MESATLSSGVLLADDASVPLPLPVATSVGFCPSWVDYSGSRPPADAHGFAEKVSLADAAARH